MHFNHKGKVSLKETLSCHLCQVCPFHLLQYFGPHSSYESFLHNIINTLSISNRAVTSLRNTVIAVKVNYWACYHMRWYVYPCYQSRASVGVHKCCTYRCCTYRWLVLTSLHRVGWTYQRTTQSSDIGNGHINLTNLLCKCKHSPHPLLRVQCCPILQTDQSPEETACTVPGIHWIPYLKSAKCKKDNIFRLDVKKTHNWNFNNNYVIICQSQNYFCSTTDDALTMVTALLKAVNNNYVYFILLPLNNRVETCPKWICWLFFSTYEIQWKSSHCNDSFQLSTDANYVT